MSDVSQMIFDAEQKLKAGTFDKIDLHRFAVECMEVGRKAAPYQRETVEVVADLQVERQKRGK